MFEFHQEERKAHYMKTYKVTLKGGMYNPGAGLDDDTTYEWVEADNEDEAWKIAQDKFMQEYFHHMDGQGRVVVDVREDN